MTLENFTIKAQEAVQEAVNTAQRASQQVIEPVHILKGVMEKAQDVTKFLNSLLHVFRVHARILHHACSRGVHLY